MADGKNLTPQLAADAADLCACFNVRRTARAVTRMFDDALQAVGLRSTQFVLLISVHAHGDRGLPALASAMGVDRSALTRRLKPLERQGWVKVTASAAAGPSRVRLTAKGRRKAESAVPLWEDVQGRFVKGVGGKRWRSMLADLRTAYDAAQGRP